MGRRVDSFGGREFGFINLVLIDPKGGIIAGHGRVLAARQLEMAEIPTICGDSTVATDVERVLGGAQPDLMVTDPPYGVNYDADWRNQTDRANGKPYGARAVGKVENDAKSDWREAWALFPGDVAYCWHASLRANSAFDSLVAALRGVTFTTRSIVLYGNSNIPRLYN